MHDNLGLDSPARPAARSRRCCVPACVLLHALLALSIFSSADTALGLNLSVPRINGGASRAALGDGTGIIIGIIDSGIDDTHPALAGNDSQGNPRMVAEANFVTTEAGNTGDDVFGHGTGVAGVSLSADATNRGLAPDARFVNARAIDSGNNFATTDWVIDAAGFALAQGTDILNMSLNIFSTAASSSNGSQQLDRMVDWAVFDPRQGTTAAVCVGNISAAQGGGTTPRSPGGSFNAVSVGWTKSPGYNDVHADSSFGPTSDGRSKPDVVAPGHNIFTANDDWETQNDFVNRSGCSFATPHVAGMLAQQMDYGRSHALDTSPAVLKATLINSAEKVHDVNGNAWEPADSAVVGGVLEIYDPLDSQAGAGQVNGKALVRQYLAGEQAPGNVDPVGWDLNAITGLSNVDYTLNVPTAGPGVTLTTTLTWMRHVQRTDDGDFNIDHDDSYTTGLTDDALDDLDLSLLLNGNAVAKSISSVDNVEHIHWNVTQPGAYTVRVSRLAVANSGNDELYAVAWRVVPEPSGLTLALLAGVTIALLRRRH